MSKAHRLVYHSAQSWIVLQKKKKRAHRGSGSRVRGLGFRGEGLVKTL